MPGGASSACEGAVVTAATGLAEPVGSSGRVRAFLRLVVVEHSVFALPFAYVAALTAMRSVGDRVRWWDLVLVTVAMVAARTFAMAANRVIDRELDARNPRTAQRELVTGAVSVRTAVVGAVVALAVFLAAAALLSPLCLALAPLAVVPLVGYPYTKRVTWLCHAALGLAQAVAPVGAWIAVTGEWSWDAVLLGLAVGTWIGSFDLIYACQDVASDRREGVSSVPARFGVAAALRASSVVHVLTVALLVWFGLSAGFGALWFTGVALTALALAYEHTLVRPDDLSKVGRAFFTVNGYVGLGLLLFAVADLAVRGLRA
jgi:4-hydroxybenzoate polyprenyltransferase